MEHGFFHPERGYWQTNETPAGAVLESYPEGTVEVPLKPGEFFEWDAGAQAWAEVAPPVPSEAEALRQIDADTDALYAQVIGNRAAEYEQAERDARAWTEAGSTGTAPATVASWAAASGMTPDAAAADILAQAAAWRGAMEQIRGQRLGSKALVRTGQVALALQGWAAFLVTMRGALGV